MVLFLILIILLFIFSLFRISFVHELHTLVNFSHNYCLEKLPSEAAAIAELKAIVCAENFSNLSRSQYYIASGLIHLFVVSGAHLVLLEQALLKLSKDKKIPVWFIFSVLFTYGLMCGLNPPVTRCLVSYSIQQYLFSKNIRWPAHMRVLIVGALTLSFNPDWINSLSLQMSWLAAFAVGLGNEFFKKTSVFFRQSLFFVLLFPSLMFFQLPRPSVIVANIFLAPVLEFLLFPLGLFVLFFNFAYPVFDFIIEIFLGILKLLEFEYTHQLNSFPDYAALLNWLIIFILHLIVHFLYVYRRRK